MRFSSDFHTFIEHRHGINYLFSSTEALKGLVLDIVNLLRIHLEIYLIEINFKTY